MSCRSGCPTQDHKTWGECARQAHISTQWLGGTGSSYGDEKRWNAENEAYVQAKKDGLQPETPDYRGIREAYAQAERE